MAVAWLICWNVGFGFREIKISELDVKAPREFAYSNSSTYWIAGGNHREMTYPGTVPFLSRSLYTEAVNWKFENCSVLF